MLALGLPEILISIPHLMLKRFGHEIDYCKYRLYGGALQRVFTLFLEKLDLRVLGHLLKVD